MSTDMLDRPGQGPGSVLAPINREELFLRFGRELHDGLLSRTDATAFLRGEPIVLSHKRDGEIPEGDNFGIFEDLVRKMRQGTIPDEDILSLLEGRPTYGKCYWTVGPTEYVADVPAASKFDVWDYLSCLRMPEQGRVPGPGCTVGNAFDHAEFQMIRGVLQSKVAVRKLRLTDVGSFEWVLDALGGRGRGLVTLPEYCVALRQKQAQIGERPAPLLAFIQDRMCSLWIFSAIWKGNYCAKIETTRLTSVVNLTCPIPLGAEFAVNYEQYPGMTTT